MPHAERPVRIIEPVVPETLVPPDNEIARFNFDFNYYQPLRESGLTIIDQSTGDGRPAEGLIDTKSLKLPDTGNAAPLAYYDIDPVDQRPVIHMQQAFFSEAYTQQHRMAALTYLTFKACFHGAPKFECNLFIDYTRKNAPGVNEYDLANLLKYIDFYWNFGWKNVQYVLTHGGENRSEDSK